MKTNALLTANKRVKTCVFVQCNVYFHTYQL